ncbi:hypothetical protein GCM10028819_17740 [Spirosoma humi]
MNFLKKLFKKESTLSEELAPAIAKEVAARLSRAAELRLTGEYEQALRECNEVLLLHPTSQLAYHIRALIRYDMNDQPGAIQDWNRHKSLQKSHTR